MLQSSRKVVDAWRLELFYSSRDELVDTTELLRRHNIRRVNLTNKKDTDDLLSDIRLLKNLLPDIHVCPHYSIKYNYNRSPDVCFQKLNKFLFDVAQELPASAEVLVVSGGGKKKQFETVKALQMLATKHHGNLAAPVSVAFNPYLPDPNDFDAEKLRLQQKLATGIVSGIYLQIGTDLDRLVQGLEYIKTLLPECSSGSSVPVYGSVFVPSKRLLAQMKFRPWNGVFLSNEYLSCVESADKITRELLRVYGTYGVIPLVETRVKTDAEFEYVHDLLAAAFIAPEIAQA